MELPVRKHQHQKLNPLSFLWTGHVNCRRKQPSNFLVIWTSVTHLEELLVYGILFVLGFFGLPLFPNILLYCILSKKLGMLGFFELLF